ncbi:hypothetical protein [Streptomyces sp. NPDC060198]|uniref:hypothetical protein n=1 Tax=Streptomyces sp. NPDC060198 TaxID=3347070 RepID=UPI003667C424
MDRTVGGSRYPCQGEGSRPIVAQTLRSGHDGPLADRLLTAGVDARSADGLVPRVPEPAEAAQERTAGQTCFPSDGLYRYVRDRGVAYLGGTEDGLHEIAGHRREREDPIARRLDHHALAVSVPSERIVEAARRPEGKRTITAPLPGLPVDISARRKAAYRTTRSGRLRRD